MSWKEQMKRKEEFMEKLNLIVAIARQAKARLNENKSITNNLIAIDQVLVSLKEGE